MIQNIKTVREFAREDQEFVTYRRVQRQNGDLELQSAIMSQLFYPLMRTLLTCGKLFVFYRGAKLVHFLELPPQELTSIGLELTVAVYEVMQLFTRILPELKTSCCFQENRLIGWLGCWSQHRA